MFKDILVVLAENETKASSYALSLARHFDSHLTAVCTRRDAAPADVAMAEARFDLATSSSARGEDNDIGQLRDFAAAARDASIAAHAILPDEFEWAQPGDLQQFARCFDLIVIAQPEPKRGAVNRSPIASLLVHSGRPILAVPYIQAASASFRNVIVAWDGGRAAARALADAMPILKRANTVEVVMVTNEMDGISRQGANVTRHLALHGIAATFKPIASTIDVANILLSHAADADGSLLVMGGYGHARLREAVIGGVTRTILESMTIPVLMSH
jgi:nucleotide-binding universal stress UspA family protein